MKRFRIVALETYAIEYEVMAESLETAHLSHDWVDINQSEMVGDSIIEHVYDPEE